MHVKVPIALKLSRKRNPSTLFQMKIFFKCVSESYFNFNIVQSLQLLGLLNSDISEDTEGVGSEYYIFICVNIWQNVTISHIFIVLISFIFHPYYLLHDINLCFLVLY